MIKGTTNPTLAGYRWLGEYGLFGQERQLTRRLGPDQRVDVVSSRPKGRSPPISTPGTLLTELPLACAPTRPTTPPSGVSIRIGSDRTGLNYGVIRSHQITEKKTTFESVSILVKGGWKETRGVQRPISAETPVSESRMASLNPFETKRKKAPQRAPSSLSASVGGGGSYSGA